ncbi:MAG: hypothetical protein K8R23_16110 [Chthoniobacter sp.]|nr:hypothetical protein [Chthoniobacter sp.]
MRFFLPIPLVLALLCAGCASAGKQAKAPGSEDENSRLAEQRRVMAVERGDVASARGAEILVFDPNKKYDPTAHAVGGRTYGTGEARTKAYSFVQKANPGTYKTRDFYGSRASSANGMKYATKEAATRGSEGIPHANTPAATKTAATKEAWDANRASEVSYLHDGKREYLGKESKKLRQGIDPATLGDWRNAGETVSNGATSVEKYGTMKQLTVEDIRELLNKSK